MPINVGKKAPNFTLADEDGQNHSLSDYKGQPVVLYFYPKDDTPGCTKQACGFRDDYSVYQDTGVTVLGVSPDSSKSHTKFINKNDLPFTLLADTDREVINIRTTYLIDSDGTIATVLENVIAANHSQEILAALKDLE
jgi:peroxiredoxin Q/BCP